MLAKEASKKSKLFRVRRINKKAFHNDHVHAPHAETASLTEAFKEISSLNSAVSTSSSVSTASTLKVVDLSIDADSAWNGIFGSNSNNRITSYLNEAEVIYEQDLGITFNVVRQNVFTSTSFGTTGAVDKLCNYQYYITGGTSIAPSDCNLTASSGPQSFFGSADSYHLFTGENLAGSTIGIAYVGTICSSPANAIGLTQYTSEAITPVTFAHELGHEFAAIHDGSSGWNGIKEASCPSTSTAFVMGAAVGGTPPDNFSSCSRNLINEFVDLHGDSCLDEISGVEIPGGDSGTVPSNPTVDSLSLSRRLNGSGRLTLTADISLADGIESAAGCNLRVRYSNKSCLLYTSDAADE